MPLLLSLTAAAEELGTSRDHLRGLVNDGHLPIVRVGEDIRIWREDLTAWIQRAREFRPCLSDAVTTAIIYFANQQAGQP